MGQHKTEGYRCDEAAQQRAADNVRLVYHMVGVFKRKTGMPYLTQDEAEGIGMVALVRAAAHPNYDPARRFSTYACKCIWMALLRASESERRRCGRAFTRTNTDHDCDNFQGRPEECKQAPFTEWLRRNVRPTIKEDKRPIFDLWLDGFGACDIAKKLGKNRVTINVYLQYQRRRIREEFKPDQDHFV